MLPIARVFGLSIQTPLLATLIGVALAIELARRLANRRGLDSNTIAGVLTNSIFAFALGARLGYVLTHWPSYLKDPLGILALNTTAMLAWAGWLAAAAYAGWALWRKRLLTPALLHALLPATCVFALGQSLADLLSGDRFGTPAPAAMPWAINLWGVMRHPVQLYESLAWGMVLMALLWAEYRQWPTPVLFWLALALGAVVCVVVDGFRAEVPLAFGMRVSQLAGVLVASMALWILGRARITTAHLPLGKGIDAGSDF
jgi:phosphatidylglycerol:prolipoprotein diacylglycerol transferase